MALSKRNSRPIRVNGQLFRWSFSAPYDSQARDHQLNLTVQADSGFGSKIIGTGRSTTRDDGLHESKETMTPQIVSNIIREAIESGWSPDHLRDWYIEHIERYFDE